MRRLGVLGFGALAFACFTDSPVPIVEADDDTSQGGTGPAATGNFSTDGNDSDSGSLDTTSGGPDDGTTTDGGTTSGVCEPGTVGCPCGPNGCDAKLSCVAGTCTACGDAEVVAPEECDGPVPGGTCEACMIVCAEDFADCDGRTDNGCEIDLSAVTDCGACGHDCLGGDCIDLACQPVDLAQSQDQPLGLDVEGEIVVLDQLGCHRGQWGRAGALGNARRGADKHRQRPVVSRDGGR